MFWQWPTRLLMRHYEHTERVYCWSEKPSLVSRRISRRTVDRPMKQYLDIAALAERLLIKRSTLYAWAEQGMIPHVKLGRLLRFDPDEIDALIAEAKRTVYTSCRGKPDQDRATRKGEPNGSV